VADDAVDFSEAFATTAREEAERLRVRALELRARGERWVARGEEALSEAGRLETRVRELDEMLGRAPQMRLDLQTEALRGQRLREAALAVLVEHVGTRTPIHYRAWYRLLTDRGLVAAGKDPVATFLIQITRSPLIERVEGKGGVYQVDPGAAYERARAALAAASRDLSAAQDRLSGAADSASSAHEGAVGEVRAAGARFAQAQRDLDRVIAARETLRRERSAAA
jgi:hypothetical protein